MSRRENDTIPDPFEGDELAALEAALAGAEPRTPGDAEWADLVALVRDEPPARDPIARVALDQRVAKGFPKPGRLSGTRLRGQHPGGPNDPSGGATARPGEAGSAPGHGAAPRSGASGTGHDGGRRRRANRRGGGGTGGWRPMLMSVAPMLLVLVVGATVLIAALSAGGGGSDDADFGSSASSATSAATTASAAPAAPAPESDAAAGDAAAPPESAQTSTQAGRSASSGTAAPVAPPSSSGTATLKQPRQVIRSTRLELRTSAKGLQEAADGVIRATQRNAGVVETSQINATDRGGSATFVLRVPTSKLDETVKDLSALAHVTSVAADTDDVTQQSVSLKDQLADARTGRDSLIASLEQARDPGHIKQLRVQLQAAREEVARRQSAVDALKTQTNRARIDVELTGRGSSKGAVGTDTGDDSGWGPVDALKDAGRGLEVAAGVAIVALAILLPLGLLGGLGTAGGRTLRRRRRESALDPA